MQREFNSGSNQLPQSSIGTSPFPIRALLGESEVEADHLYGVHEIADYDTATGTVSTVRPSADSLSNAQVVFSPAKVAPGKTFPCGLGELGMRWVAFDPADGVPSVGDYVGTVADSYKMSMYKFGFECIDYDNTVDNERALVRPLAFQPLLVQAQSDELSGEVDVKFADVNGDLFGSAFTVYTIPEAP